MKRKAAQFFFTASPISLFLLIFNFSSHAQSLLYGTTENGGDFGAGAIFKANEDGTNIESVFSFPIQNEGGEPKTGLLLHSDGFYYGVTENGGMDNEGTLYRYDRVNNTHLVLKSFSDGNPIGGLIEASNGKIYGTLTSVPTSNGFVFEYDPVADVLTFSNPGATSIGYSPRGKLLEASNGLLYGPGYIGGEFGQGRTRGTIFSYNIATKTVALVFAMSASSGNNPYGAMIQGLDGKLYGTSTNGGTNDKGTLFSYDISNDLYADIISFGTNGIEPRGDLLQLPSGMMYGTTRLGGTSGDGTVFKFDPTNGVLTSIYSFNPTSGTEPYRGFTLASSGNLFAMTYLEGANGGGSLIEFDPVTELVTNRHDFDVQGSNPIATLVEGPSGILLGTTTTGGAGDKGVIFEYDINNTSVSKKIDFGVGLNGESSYSPLLLHNGYLYGATAYGGANNGGVLFRFDPKSNTNTILHSFESATGNLPIGELMIASDGKLYGTTNQGGTNDHGTIYSFDLINDKHTLIASFGDVGIEGDRPQQGLFEASNGKLYGTTRFGGTGSNGALHEYDPQSGSASTIYLFDAMSFGPRCMLEEGTNGILYGTAEKGGSFGKGVIFSYDIANSAYNIEASFGSGGVGASPVSGLFKGQNGEFYGVSPAGGTFGGGVVYEFNPTSSMITPLAELTLTQGAQSWGRFTASSNGNLYTATRTNAAGEVGSIIELDTISNLVTKKADMPTAIGSSRVGSLSVYCLEPLFNENQPTTYNVCASDAFSLTLGSSNTDTYTWMKDGIVDANITTDVLSISSLTAGDDGVYEVFLINQCGSTSFTFSLNVTEITSGISSKDATCDGSDDGSITITTPTGGSAPYEYSIDGGTTFGSTGNFTGLAPGTYDVHVKENGGCTISESVVIELSMISTATIADVVCNGESSGSISLVPSGGLAPYEFSLDGSNFQSSASFDVIAGSYTVTTKDANGCTVSTAASVNEPTAISFTTTQIDLECNGDAGGAISVTASGGVGVLEYSIDGTTFQAGSAFSGLDAGNYAVSVQDENGCVVTENLTLAEPAVLTVAETIENNTCFEAGDGSVQLVASGGTAPYAFELGGVSNTIGLFDNLAAGAYTGKVTDANNCEVAVNYTITEPVLLEATVTETGTSSCGLADGSLDVVATGGTAPYSYSFDGGSFQAESTFSGLSAGSYSIVARDVNLCEISLTASIDDPVTATFTTTVTDVLCHSDNSGSIEISVSGGTAPLTYSIDGSIFQSSNSFLSLVAGDYTVLVREGNGCGQSFPVTISEPSTLAMTFTSMDILCAGEATGSISLSGIGGTGTLSYSIDGANFTTVSTFDQLSAGTYDIFVRDENACTTSGSVTLAEPAALDATLTIVDASCEGSMDGSITVNTSGGVAPYSYSLDNETPQADNVFESINPGTYVLSISDANNCSFSLVDLVVAGTVVVNVSASVADALCFGESTGALMVTATGGDSPYAYSLDGTNFQSGVDLSDLAAGNYTITAKDSNGCMGTVSANVSEPTTLSLTVIQDDSDFSLAANGGVAPYEYSLDGTTFQSSGSFTDLDPGAYVFTAQDANSCTIISETFSIVLGLADVEVDIAVYPNPVGEYFTITVEQAATVEVYDVGGRLVSSKEFVPEMNVQGLKPGLYVLLVKDEEGITRAKGTIIKE